MWPQKVKGTKKNDQTLCTRKAFKWKNRESLKCFIPPRIGLENTKVPEENCKFHYCSYILEMSWDERSWADTSTVPNLLLIPLKCKHMIKTFNIMFNMRKLGYNSFNVYFLVFFVGGYGSLCVFLYELILKGVYKRVLDKG